MMIVFCILTILIIYKTCGSMLAILILIIWIWILLSQRKN